MSYLLDTNVVSELRKPASRADAAVREWASKQALSDLWLSVVTILEVEVGVARIARRDTDQSERLRRWIDVDLLPAFAGRILPVDVSVARRAAALHVPDPRPERDVLIAATALTHDLTVVTRNVADFARLDVRILDP